MIVRRIGRAGRRPTRLRLALLVAVVVLLAGSVEGAAAKSLPGASNCPIFPASNVWNRRVDAPARSAPTRRRSSPRSGSTSGLHPDFGSYSAATASRSTWSASRRREVRCTFQLQSPNRTAGRTRSRSPVKREAGSDRHILIVDKTPAACTSCSTPAKSATGHWSAGSGAIWNLRSTGSGPTAGRAPTPPACRSCPGSRATTRSPPGVIAHALRFTAPTTRSAHIYPARHDAGDGNDPAAAADGPAGPAQGARSTCPGSARRPG